MRGMLSLPSMTHSPTSMTLLILSRKTFCAVHDVCPNRLLNGVNNWDEDHLNYERIPVMKKEQLLSLHQSGLVDCGSHTVDHVPMRRLPVDEIRRQARVSKNFLEDLLGVPIDMFAYPFGQLDDFSRLTSIILREEVTNLLLRQGGVPGIPREKRCGCEDILRWFRG